jgi:glycerol uptake facilitator protein
MELGDIFLGEFLGLAAFVLIHGGILASMVLNGKAEKGIAALAVFLGISFGVFVAIAGGSGAHINPAVTAAFLVEGSIDVTEALIYILGQLTGGFVGGLLLWVIYRPQFKESKDPLAPLTGNPQQKDVVQNVVTSFLGSFFLALLVLITVSALNQEGSVVGALTPLAVGGAVLAAALAFGGVSYAMVNVARDLGPRLTATVLKLGTPTWGPALLLVLASLAGGALAGFVATIL